MPERAVLGLHGEVEDLARDVELPVAPGATKPAVLAEPHRQVRAAVRAPGVQQPQDSAGVPPSHEVLAEHAHADRLTVGRGQLVSDQDRKPEAADQLAHRRAGAHLGEQFIVLARKHMRALRKGRSRTF